MQNEGQAPALAQQRALQAKNTPREQVIEAAMNEARTSKDSGEKKRARVALKQQKRLVEIAREQETLQESYGLKVKS